MPTAIIFITLYRFGFYFSIWKQRKQINFENTTKCRKLFKPTNKKICVALEQQEQRRIILLYQYVSACDYDLYALLLKTFLQRLRQSVIGYQDIDPGDVTDLSETAFPYFRRIRQENDLRSDSQH